MNDIESHVISAFGRLFISVLDDEHSNMLYDGDPFIALDQFKELAFRACAKVWQAILTNAPTTLGAKLLVKRVNRHRQAVLRVFGFGCQL